MRYEELAKECKRQKFGRLLKEDRIIDKFSKGKQDSNCTSGILTWNRWWLMLFTLTGFLRQQSSQTVPKVTRVEEEGL